MDEKKRDSTPSGRALTFYSLSTCAMCRRGRDYLDEKGYAYRVVLVDQLEAGQKTDLKAELGRAHGVRVAFPALEIDGRRLVLGFYRDAWDKALAEASEGV